MRLDQTIYILLITNSSDTVQVKTYLISIQILIQTLLHFLPFQIIHKRDRHLEILETIIFLTSHFKYLLIRD